MADRTPANPNQGPTEAELRELAVRGETLRQQLVALEGQREYIAELLGEARRSLTSLEHLVNAKEGDEVLLPLGGGAYVHARLANPTVAIASLGSGVHAEMPTADARDRLQGRVTSLESAATNLARDISRLTEEMTRINAVLESIYGG